MLPQVERAVAASARGNARLRNITGRLEEPGPRPNRATHARGRRDGPTVRHDTRFEQPVAQALVGSVLRFSLEPVEGDHRRDSGNLYIAEDSPVLVRPVLRRDVDLGSGTGRR